MQRWHLAFFPWVNSGSFFFLPLPSLQIQSGYFCAYVGKWTKVPVNGKSCYSFINRVHLPRILHSKSPSDTLDESRMQSSILEAFIGLLLLLGPGLHRGLFIVPVVFAFFFSPHEQRVYRKKKRKEQSLNIMALGARGKCAHGQFHKNLLHLSRKQRGIACCAFRGPQRLRFSMETIFIRRCDGENRPGFRH